MSSLELNVPVQLSIYIKMLSNLLKLKIWKGM